MEAKISAGLGMIVGVLLSAPFTNFLAVILMAFLTGAAGWAGQKACQWAWAKYGLHAYYRCTTYCKQKFTSKKFEHGQNDDRL